MMNLYVFVLSDGTYLHRKEYHSHLFNIFHSTADFKKAEYFNEKDYERLSSLLKKSELIYVINKNRYVRVKKIKKFEIIGCSSNYINY